MGRDRLGYLAAEAGVDSTSRSQQVSLSIDLCQLCLRLTQNPAAQLWC